MSVDVLPVRGHIRAAADRISRRTAAAALIVALLFAALLGLGPALLAGSPVLAGLPDPGSLVRGGVIVLRLALDVLGIGLVGLLALPLLVPPGSTVPNLARRYTGLLAIAWSAAAVLALWWRTAEVSGTSLFDVRTDDLLAFVQTFGAGRALVLTAACGAIVAGVAAVRRSPSRLPELWVGIALLGLLAAPISGHATDHPTHAPAVVLVAAHVMAAAGWVGGLAALLLVFGRDPDGLAATLPRFSVLATAAIATVTVTGVLNAFVRVPDVTAAAASGYAALLVAKSLALLALAAFGWHARTRLLPRLAARGAGSLVVGWLLAELVLMAFVLGLAAALAQSPGGG